MKSRLFSTFPSIAILVFVLTTYWLISYGDSAELITASYTLGIPHAPGYPLYMMIGKLFSSFQSGNVAHRYSLLCGAFGALTVLLIYWTTRALTRSALAATGSALVLAFAYHFWLYSLVPEVTSLSGLLVAVILWVLLTVESRTRLSRRQIWLLVFSYGLGLTHQHTLLLLAPGLMYYILSTAD
jgi:hypothetical protein